MNLISETPSFKTIEQITLEKIKFGVGHVMSASLRNQLKLTIESDIFSDAVVRQIQGYLLGNKVNTFQFDNIIKIYPATMWEELKEDFAPKWFLKRWPVKYHKEICHHTVNHYHVCPHLDAPDNTKHLYWCINKSIE